MIGYTLYNETLGRMGFRNHEHPCASHACVYISFRWYLKPVDPSVSLYNLIFIVVDDVNKQIVSMELSHPLVNNTH